MSTKYQYMLVDPASGEDIGVVSLDDPLTEASQSIFIGLGPSRKQFFFRNLDDEAPSEESVRFHEDQIERFERNIEEMQAQIGLHQQWLDEKTRQTWDIALTLTDIQIIRSALDEHLQHPERKHYNLLVRDMYGKIDQLHTEATGSFTYDGPSYPEMMKYPGKITVDDPMSRRVRHD